MKKIVIIEDNIKLREYMAKYLQGYNYSIFIVSDFNHLEEEVFNINPDLILLDINRRSDLISNI